MRVTKGVTNNDLAEVLAARISRFDRVAWSLRTLSGGFVRHAEFGAHECLLPVRGRAMLNALCRHAESVGVDFIYEAHVDDVRITHGFCRR